MLVEKILLLFALFLNINSWLKWNQDSFDCSQSYNDYYRWSQLLHLCLYFHLWLNSCWGLLVYCSIVCLIALILLCLRRLLACKFLGFRFFLVVFHSKSVLSSLNYSISVYFILFLDMTYFWSWMIFTFNCIKLQDQFLWNQWMNCQLDIDSKVLENRLVAIIYLHLN